MGSRVWDFQEFRGIVSEVSRLTKICSIPASMLEPCLGELSNQAAGSAKP